jgi:hypothetical protein
MGFSSTAWRIGPAGQQFDRIDQPRRVALNIHGKRLAPEPFAIL